MRDFKKEFKILSLLEHENIIGFYGASLTPQVCMVMDLCENSSLDRVLKSKHSIGWEVTGAFCFQLASALTEIHRLGIFHRDIKAQNILVSNSLTIKLADFGEAIFEKESEEVSGMAGTIGWSAPGILFFLTVFFLDSSKKPKILISSFFQSCSWEANTHTKLISTVLR